MTEQRKPHAPADPTVEGHGSQGDASGQRFTTRRWTSARAALVAVVLGAAAAGGALCLGYTAYQRALRAAEARYYELYQQKSQTLAALVELINAPRRRVALERFSTLWAGAAEKPADEHLFVLDADARVLLDSRKPPRGRDTGGHLVLGEGGPPAAQLRDMMSAQSDFMGEYIPKIGGAQIAAFAVSPETGWWIGVHRSKRAVAGEVFRDLEPVILGFVVLCGAFIPCALFLLSTSYRMASQQRCESSRDLTESRTQMDMLARAAPSVIFRADMAGRFVFVTRRWRDLTGAAEGSWVGRGWAMAVHPEDRPGVLSSWDQAIKAQQGWQCEFRFLSPSGQARWVLAASEPLCADNGKVESFIGTCTDITDHKHAEMQREHMQRQLVHAQKMEAVGQLAGGIAHDFNNLLTAILGNAETMSAEIRAGHSQANEEMLLTGIEQIELAGQRAAQLTRQLLAFSRKQVRKSSLVNLNDIVKNMQGMLRRLIEEFITIDVVAGCDLPNIRADAGQIEQVVLNLILNARDAMPCGGRATIETLAVAPDAEATADFTGDAPSGYVLLRVKDAGVGMDAETRSRLFEPFFTTKALGRGTGLGMATVYGIVQSSGGHIVVDSAPDEGTVVHIYLPIAEELGGNVARPAQVDDTRAHGETVLVCEDEDFVRQVACSALRASGYEVLEAADGRAAIDIAESFEGKIDLLISDVVMPGMSGRELAQRLKHQKPDLAVLYVTGYAPDLLDHEGDDDPVLEKPFGPTVLLPCVRATLDMQGAKRT